MRGVSPYDSRSRQAFYYRSTGYQRRIAHHFACGRECESRFRGATNTGRRSDSIELPISSEAMNPFTLYWHRRLYTLLNDKPDKTASIHGNEDHSRMLKALDCFAKDGESQKQADWQASAADRLPLQAPAHLRQDSADITGCRP